MDPNQAGLISRLKAIIQAHPELFPNPANLSSLDGLPYRLTLSPSVPKSVWDELQVEWIRVSSETDFLAACSAKTMNRCSEAVNQAINQKLLYFVTMTLRFHPRMFPTFNGILDLDIPHLNSTLFARIPKSTWDKLQSEWVAQSSDGHFLAAVSNKAVRTVSTPVDEAINQRLLKVTKLKLSSHPETFPCPHGVSKLPNMPSRSILTSRISETTWDELQLEWARTSSREHFLAALSDRSMNSVPESLTRAIDTRLLVIVKQTIASHPARFPTCANLSKLDQLPVTSVLTLRIPKPVLDELQTEWIKTSSQDHFLAAFSGNFMSGVSKQVNEAINQRLRAIVIDNLTGSLPLPDLDKKTLPRRVPDFRDILVLVGFVRGTRSPDQQIVSKIGLKVSEREDWVNNLLSERLEQLWFFRELVVLVRTGHATAASVVSLFNETLPVRLAALIPTANIQHINLETLEDGVSELASNRTILLSVAPWLSSGRAANLFRNLALSSTEGHEVVFTYPESHALMPDAADNLAKLGFELVGLGRFRLTPASDALEQGKLEQSSNVGLLRRMATASIPLDKLDLFLRVKNASPKLYTAPNAITRTYSLDDLAASTPSLVFYPPRAEIFQSGTPVLTVLDVAPDSFILTFSGGEVAGFHMDPHRANVVEIEGARVSQGVIHTTLELLSGGTPRIDISDEVAGLRERYTAFVSHLNVQKPKVAAADIKRTATR